MSNVPNNKVPLALPPVTTGRPVRTQAAQGSPRLCGAWGKAVGGRGRCMGSAWGVREWRAATERQELKIMNIFMKHEY